MIATHNDPSWWFHTSLDPHLSPTARQAWYRRLHARFSVQGLAGSTRQAVSVVLGVHRPLGIDDRDRLLTWLVDEPAVWAIQVGELSPVGDLLTKGFPVIPVADLWRATGLPQSRLDDSRQETLKAIVHAAICDWMVKRAPGMGPP